MKRTRNLFVLTAKSEELIPRVLKELQFKGVNVQDVSKEVTSSDILDTFSKNKSLICTGISKKLAKVFPPIQITVSDGNQPHSFVTSSHPCIDVTKDIAKQFEAIANGFGCDIGDHISNSSGLNGAPSVADCAYCRYLLDPTVEYPRTIYRNNDFFVYTTLGQFIPGYLLIIPIEHVMSIAELDSRRRQEFLEVLDDIRYILNLTYNADDNILVWENGTGNSGKGKAKDSVVHAHVHVACSNMDEEQISDLSGFPMTSIPFEGLSSYGKHSYLLLKDKYEGDWKINDDPELYIPRQYIRQLLANEYGIPGEEWNWRKYPFHDRRIKATEDIYRALKANWDTLPERIRQSTQDFLSTFHA